MMQESFRAALRAASPVTEMCGNRIDLGGNPQGSALPRIVIWTIGDNEEHDLDGPCGHSIGRVQVDCYGKSYTEAVMVSCRARTALDGYSGHGFQDITHQGTRDNQIPGTGEADRPFVIQLDFITNFDN